MSGRVSTITSQEKYNKLKYNPHACYVLSYLPSHKIKYLIEFNILQRKSNIWTVTLFFFLINLLRSKFSCVFKAKNS